MGERNANLMLKRIVDKQFANFFSEMKAPSMLCNLSELAVSLRITRFNIQQFHMVLALR